MNCVYLLQLATFSLLRQSVQDTRSFFYRLSVVNLELGFDLVNRFKRFTNGLLNLLGVKLVANQLAAGFIMRLIDRAQQLKFKRVSLCGDCAKCLGGFVQPLSAKNLLAKKLAVSIPGGGSNPKLTQN